MPAITTARRMLLALVACFAFASVSVAPALGAGAHSTAHHKKHHAKKHKCAHPRGDRDKDGVEGHGGNDGDGCGV
ncbi:MAG: hypothetical protein NVSMB51_08860 [Solirubrobacteraceae bacterium]